MSSISEIPDNKLVENIKQDNCNDSMNELINRHSNLVYNKIHSFYKRYPNINLPDLLEDIYLIFNNSVKSFNSDKNTKFSTWLAEMTRFHCLNTNKDKDKIINFQNEEIDSINSKYNRFSEDNNKLREFSSYIFEILKQLHDKRIYQIYKLRYFGYGNKDKLMSWNTIGKKFNLSTSQIINLHNRGKEFLIKKLKSNEIVDKI